MCGVSGAIQMTERVGFFGERERVPLLWISHMNFGVDSIPNQMRHNLFISNVFVTTIIRADDSKNSQRN